MSIFGFELNELEALLQNPLAVYGTLFEGASENQRRGNVDLGERELVQAVLNTPSLSTRVPFLSRASLIKGELIPNSLIRYRGMVQDIYNTEYYLGVGVETSRKSGLQRFITTKYRDTVDTSSEDLDIDFDNKDSCTFERTSLFLVPIPGESAWVQASDIQSEAKSEISEDRDVHAGNKKRTGAHRDETNDSSAMLLEDSAYSTIEDAGVNGIVEMAKRGIVASEMSSGSSSSSSSSSKAKETAVIPPLDVSPAFYFDNEINICCIAKMYESGAEFRLNDMVEVVGIYTLDYNVVPDPARTSEIEYILDPTLGLTDCDLGDTMPPSSIAPRLHCITFRRIGSSFPLLQSVRTADAVGVGWGSVARCSPFTHPVGGGYELERGRIKVLSDLAEILFGDALAAEYVLLALLSRVVARTNSEVILGYMPIVLSGLEAKDERIGALRQLLSEVVPRCVSMDANIAALNAITILPQKDYERNRISPSPLQVGEGTAVLIDETGLDEGKLSENGLRSAHALRTVASRQILPVSFTYCEVQVPTDACLVFMTRERSGSLFAPPDTVRIHLCSGIARNRDGDGGGDGARDGGKAMNTDMQFDEARMWWATTRNAAQTQQVAMDSHMTKHVEDDFVKSRQNDPSLTTSDFHAWLTVARLLALSYGESDISQSTWSRMKELEAQRRERNVFH